MLSNAAPAKINEDTAVNSDDKEAQSISNEYKTSNSSAFPELTQSKGT